MKTSKTVLLWLLFLLQTTVLYAQDSIPKPARTDRMSIIVPSSEAMEQLFRLIPVEDAMPQYFANTGVNEIEDLTGELTPFFEKIQQKDAVVRIVHIGDSHVRGHAFPYVMRKCLEEDFGSEAVIDKPVTYKTSGLAEETGNPGIIYHMIGVNGATCGTFSTPERIQAIVNLKPDLIICSFGTNEAHALHYSSAEHRARMEQLVNTLEVQCPKTCFLFTTPPGAYVRRRRNRRQTVNSHTPLVVATQKAFCRDRHFAIWDMYEAVGGKASACSNWTRGNYFRKDGIHFTHEGYELQGKLLHQAFIKAYNNYVGDRLD